MAAAHDGRARRPGEVIDLPASHSPFLSMPERLAGVLAEVDSASGAGQGWSVWRRLATPTAGTPTPATSSDKPRSNHEDHDLRLGIRVTPTGFDTCHFEVSPRNVLTCGGVLSDWRC